MKKEASGSKDNSTENQLQHLLDILKSAPVKQTAVASPSLSDSKS
jgi:hypothetical protein